MRVLFTTFAAWSHLITQVPMAWALRAAGHDVCVASQPDLVADITRTGLTAVGVGAPLNQDEDIREFGAVGEQESLTEAFQWATWPEMLNIAELDPGTLTYDYVHGVFAAYTPLVFHYYSMQMLDDLVEFARVWRPDLVIWDTMTFAGSVAAIASGAAHARLLFGLDVVGRMRETYRDLLCRRTSEVRDDPMEEWLAPTLERHGCEFSEEAVVGQWTIDPVPPSVRLPVALPSVPVRYVPYNGAATIPEWLLEPPERRRVCLTLGVSHREVLGGDRGSIGELLDAVADLDVEVVATLNSDQLASLPGVPDNVRAVDFVPLDALMPSCSAIINHGGAGSVQTALAHGVPQIVVPDMLWDSALKARRLQEAGVGLCVRDTDRLSADEMRNLLSRVLEEPSFAANAARLRGEMLATPAPRDVVPVLERLTAEHRAARVVLR